MTELHPITRWLTEEMRRAIVAAEYRRQWERIDVEGQPWLERSRQPLTAEGCCPMGVLLQSLGEDARTPNNIETTDALLDHVGRDDTLEALDYARLVEEMDAAVNAFCRSWDTGEITPDDLRAALGVA